MRRRRLRLGSRGTTSAEFALVGAVLLVLLIGAIETCRYLLTAAALRTAAADAVRLATLVGGANLAAGRASCSGLSGPLDGAQARAPVLDAAQLSVTLTGCARNGAVTTVTVRASYPFRFALPLAGARERNITEVAQAVIY